jgi:hypothetical protein
VHPGVLVKVAVMRVLIGSAAWAGRRFGEAVAGLGGWATAHTVAGRALSLARARLASLVTHGVALVALRQMLVQPLTSGGSRRSVRASVPVKGRDADRLRVMLR